MIPALGRPFGLGMLYDRRSDKLIPEKTLWPSHQLIKAQNSIPTPYTNFEVFTENTIEDKASALNIKADMTLSFLSGLVKDVEGAAKYFNDCKTSKLQSRVVLKYETTTELKQLQCLEIGKVQCPEVFEEDTATDVVVGILYGAKALMVFDKEVSEDESLREVESTMKVLVKSLPDIAVDGHGSVEITEEQKKNTENMRCKIYGDFRTSESPTSYEEAVRLFKQFPSLIDENGEKAVPIEVYLRPLTYMDSRCERIVREISTYLVNKTTAVHEHLQSVIRECNDLIREKVCGLFPRLKRQLTAFMKSIELYKVFLQEKVLSVIPKIRGGGAEESELAKMIEESDLEISPFSRKNIENWLVDKKREIKRLQEIVHLLNETQVIGPEAVKNELYDPVNEFIVCCTFKIACEEDELILKMNAYINDPDRMNEGSTNQTFKADGISTYKNVRETLTHLTKLKSVNRENNSVKFLATDDPLKSDYAGNTGAFLHFYKVRKLENKDLRSCPRPTNLRLLDTGESTIHFSWDVSAGKNATSFNVQYKGETSTEEWSSVEVSRSSNGSQQTVTLTKLQPATNYIVRVCAVEKIIVSEYSDEFSATTKPASPPGKPQLNRATSDSLTISFTKPERIGTNVRIINYKVEWSSDPNWTTRNVQHTDDSTPTLTLEHLTPSLFYVFRVAANCGDAGESNTSPCSDAFLTDTQTFQIDKILGSCQLIQPPEACRPAIYALPLTSIHEDRTSQLRKYKIKLCHKKKRGLRPRKPTKVVMMVGSTGSGKTTIVNAMINHLLGVKWRDPFRLKMIHEDSANQGTDAIGDQSCSQTQFVTCYTLPYVEGFKVNIFYQFEILQIILKFAFKSCSCHNC